MADPLPSFVELMETLGLEKDEAHQNDTCSESAPHCSQKRTPVIIVSECKSATSLQNAKSDRRGSAGNIRAARFTPYSSAMKRGSLPATTSSDEESLRPHSSPRLSHQPHSAGSQSTSRELNNEIRRNVRHRLRLDTSSCTPISIFVRRRSPHASPTLSSPPQSFRRASTDSPNEVVLPTLPPLFAPILAPNTSIDDDDTIMNLDSPAYERAAARSLSRTLHHHVGIRISAPFRSCAQQSVRTETQRSPLFLQ